MANETVQPAGGGVDDAENYTDPNMSFDANFTLLADNQTSWLLKNATSTNISQTTSHPTETYIDDNSIIAKITLLLVVTAVVLIVSYKFVVRLFLGYADRKDDVVPEGFSDDEDSAVVKRAVDPYSDFG